MKTKTIERITPAEVKQLLAQNLPKLSGLDVQEAEEMWLTAIREAAEEGNDTAHVFYDASNWHTAPKWVKVTTAHRLEKAGFHVAHLSDNNFFVYLQPSLTERVLERLVGTGKRTMMTSIIIITFVVATGLLTS